MKYKMSISVDENTVAKVQEALRNRKFRNKSHVFEYAVQKILSGEINEKN